MKRIRDKIEFNSNFLLTKAESPCTLYTKHIQSDHTDVRRILGGVFMVLTKEQRERYSRNIAAFGEEGQERLARGKVLVVGAGGLGSPIAYYLTAAGVGTVGIVDYDVVDASNLQRQILHSTETIGQAKVHSAKMRLTALNPDVTIQAYEEKVTKESLPKIIDEGHYDFVIDGTDNFTAKFLINDVCVAMGMAFSHAGVLRYGGQTMTYVPGRGPCYRCIFEKEPAPSDVPTSRDVGILGAVAGTIGTIQATEAIKYLLGMTDTLLVGKLLIYDGETMTFRRIDISKNPHCTACGKEHIE